MSSIAAHRVSTGERINAAAGAGALLKALEDRGIRLTRQRRVILEVMDKAERHLDADGILERAQKLDPGVHRVTVYRTIELLKKYGLIDELDLLRLRGHQHSSQSHRPRHPTPLRCLRSGQVRQ